MASCLDIEHAVFGEALAIGIAIKLALGPFLELVILELRCQDKALPK